jgi:DMSO/TMAO reductase YedYZ heme-binding membrane subunit
MRDQDKSTGRRAGGLLEGWPLFFLVAALLSGLYLVLVLPDSEESLRRMIRTSGKISALLFALAFAASSLVRVWRGRRTLWLRRNRRIFGVSFAWSQTLHLVALIVLGNLYPQPFRSGLDLVTIVGGGLVYVFIFTMAATSSDRAVRALGPKAWGRLHWYGSWMIWIVLAQTILPGALDGNISNITVMIFLLPAAALRVLPRQHA